MKYKSFCALMYQPRLRHAPVTDHARSRQSHHMYRCPSPSPVASGLVALALSTCSLLAQTAPAAKPPDMREVWNQRFTKGDSLANNQPNAFLARMVAGRKPGKALDVGMGQGRNAVFLAQAGWDVTGFDISDVALRMAEEHAKAANVKITTIQQDLREWHYGKHQWDLVVLCYMQGDARFRANEIIDSLKPGGIVVIEPWHEDMDKDLGRKVGGFTTNEVFKAYGDIRIRHYEDLRAAPDWGKELGGVPRPIVRIMAEKPAPENATP